MKKKQLAALALVVARVALPTKEEQRDGVLVDVTGCGMTWKQFEKLFRLLYNHILPAREYHDVVIDADSMMDGKQAYWVQFKK